ncbi:Ubiquitin carboxyl-terminal hydrolase 19-like [Homarus americanus]|uniref:Ubiquitin carboxyl-terminal hydrolase 19-like n=1 Tax=Homarus americanus TaxID=6706 RepID=A0A8J5N457_HOMAM|nr:Ubiquitin carboxyl-terminal hydrolase 19-like [Homarus americanus]
MPGNSVSNDLAHDWMQKNEFVIVSVWVGQGHDNRTVNINTDETELTVSLPDGRKFSTQLFETVLPEATSMSYKGARCIVKLLKSDPNIHWPHLEPAKKPTPEKIISTKAKSSSLSPGKTPEKKPAEVDNKVDNNTVCVSNVKIDYMERDAESLIVVFLYIKNINKETSFVTFTEDSISASFSTSDGRFLQQYSGSTEDTVFEWDLTLKDKVVLEDCKFKVNPNNIEIKLKKQNNKKWGALTAVTPDSAASNKVAKNMWMAASKTETPTLSNIPPAPPIPPSMENKVLYSTMYTSTV